MCRRNQLIGCALLAFGLGILIGSYTQTGFITLCLGIGIIAGGFWMLCRNRA